MKKQDLCVEIGGLWRGDEGVVFGVGGDVDLGEGEVVGVRVEGVVRKLDGGELVVEVGRLEGKVKLKCVRCLVEYVEKVVVEDERVVFLPEGVRVEEGEDGFWVYDLRGRVVDLGGWVREEVLLNLPVVRVCDEGCRGLCEVCGGNRNEVECGCERGGGGVAGPLAGLRDLWEGGE